ncbi:MULTISPECIES: protein jag [unclassified Spirulina]|uniref:Jag family protein n=1 Tax=unclassified Spirulina TaxID=2684457 RepID=UPI00194F3D05|nr:MULTISPECIES: R3H domain-containing nucleic acid-binding protein [Spirulina]MEA5472349.1 R3H domain-containing nucleic acid-binding protein [Spirulina sp. 06S082]
MKKQIEKGQAWLEKLLKLMGFSTAVGIAKLNDDGACWLTIAENKLSSEQISILIGKQGRTIDAIQYLINTVVNMGGDRETQQPFTVEIDGYRLQRQEELRGLVDEVSQLVRETGREVEMKSLSSAERRQVHNFLKESNDLTTESRGLDPDRRLFVKLR